MRVLCKIQKYDPAVVEAPFTFIDAGEVFLEDTDPQHDRGGEQRWCRMWDACAAIGEQFKFYTMGDEKYRYVITVR